MSDWITDEAHRSLPRMLEAARPHFGDHQRRFRLFSQRLEEGYERVFRLAHSLYGWRWDFALHLESLVEAAASAAASRPKWLRERDDRADTGSWLTDRSTVWAMTYLDRFAGDVQGLSKATTHLESLGVTHLHLMPPYATPPGEHDGGYAVSSYRRLRDGFGSMADLADLARTLAGDGISLVMDFVANHTADDHEWAEAAKAGIEPFTDFYFMFDSREEVAPFAPYLREIFPDRGGDAFTWRADVTGPSGGKWVWTTFYPFQWDLNYANPQVLVAMVGEMLFVANVGAAVIRMDATPFLWKRPGTNCENLPETHTVLQLMNALAAIAAPSVRFLSEAIVHPDDVTRFVRPDECALGYNPLVMSVTWEAIATRRTDLLESALRDRSRLPSGCQWLTYLRSHDDIGWGFADEDARGLGLDPGGHRRFLNEFFAGEFPGSFARGARFQENPRTGDARISGTLASLAGLEAAIESGVEAQIEQAVDRVLAMQTVAFTSVGIPMLFLGDEIGALNDNSYASEATHAGDNRWMHRPMYDWKALAAAEQDPTSPAGRILAGVRKLSRFRNSRAAFGGSLPLVVATDQPGVIAYVRRGGGDGVLVVANLTDSASTTSVPATTETWVDVATDAPLDLTAPIALRPYGVLIAVAAPEVRVPPGRVR